MSVLKKLLKESPPGHVLAQPSKQQRPKLGQSPSGCPGDQQVDTEPSQEPGGKGLTEGQDPPSPPAPSPPENSPSFFP